MKSKLITRYLNKNLLVFFIFISFSFLSNNLFAQQPTLNFTISTPSNNYINVCEEAVFTITFPYNTWMNNGFTLQLTPQLFNQVNPSNPVLISNENCFNSNTQNPLAVSIANITGTTYSAIGTFEWYFDGQPTNPPANISFELHVKVDCSINYASNFIQTWNASADGVPPIIPNIVINNSANNPNALTTNIVFLKFLSIYTPQNITVTNGVATTLEFIYESIGPTGQITDMQLVGSPSCSLATSAYTIQNQHAICEFTSSPTPSGNPVGVTFNIISDIASNSPGFTTQILIPNSPINKYLHLFVTINLTGCVLSCPTEDFNLNYKCNGSFPCPYCQYSSLLSEVNFIKCSNCASLNIENAVPLKPLLPSIDDGCSNALSDFWEVTISNGMPSSNTNTGSIYKTVVHLENPTAGATGLTLINNDPANLQLDLTNCTGCILTDLAGNITTITNCTTSSNQSLCSNLFPGSIGKLDFIIENMPPPPNNYAILKFKTFKCIVENNTALLDQKKYFNQWKINAIAYDKCDEPIFNGIVQSSQSSLPPTIYTSTFGAQNGISSHSFNGGEDINLVLAYSTPISDITVAANQNYSPPYTGEIELKALFNSTADYQLIGTYAGPYHGILRINFKPDDGLKIIDLLNDVSLVTSIPSGSYSLPLKYSYKFNTGLDCESDNYYFYFDLADLNSPFISIDQLLNYGKISFNLVGCCGFGFASDNPEFNIRLALLPDPSCQNINFPSINNSGEPLCQNGNPCKWLPLSSFNTHVQLHCPGCLSPGIVIEKYSLERKTFGLQDVGNLQLATLTPIITGNPTPIAQFDSYWDNTPLDKNRSTHNDELEDRMVARFDDGNITTGYTYAMMENISTPPEIPFKVLQLSRTIPHSNSIEMDLVPISVDLYVDVLPGAIASNNTLEDPLHWGENINNHTLAHYHFSQNDLSNCLVRAGGIGFENQYFFTFDFAALSLFKVSVPDEAFFDEMLHPEQRYRLLVTYKSCGNIADGNNSTIQSIISNTMWLTGIAKQFNATIQPQPNDRAHLNPLYFPNYQCLTCSIPVTQGNLADQYFFYCQTCGNSHMFVPNNFYLTYSISPNTDLSTNISDPCSRLVSILSRNYSYGSQYTDVFKNEFRAFRYMPQSWNFTMPIGFHLLPYVANGQIPAHDGEMCSEGRTTSFFNASPFIPFNFSNPSTLTFTAIDYLNSTAGTECLNTTPFPALPSPQHVWLSDNYTSFKTKFVIEADDCFNTNPYLGPLTGMNTVFSLNTSSCDPGTAANCNNAPITVQNLAVPVNIFPETPNLIFSSLAYTPQSLTAHIPISISNTGSYIAKNVYIILPNSLPCQILLTNISLEKPDGSIIQPINGVFCLGNILPNTGIQKCTLNLNLNPCCSINPTSLTLLCGWNCTHCPVDYTDAFNNACSHNALVLDINKPNIFVDVLSDPTYVPSQLTLCSDIHYKASFKNTGQGAIVPTVITLANLPLGITVTNVSVKNPANTILPISLVPSGLSYIIPVAVLCSLGYQPQPCNSTNYLTPIIGEDIIDVDITMQADCEFANTYANINYPFPNTNWPKGPNITLTYTDFCNTISQSSEIYSQDPFPYLSQTNPSNCGDCAVIYKVANPSSVNLPGQVVNFTVTVTNASNATITANVSDNLPPLYDFSVLSNDLNPSIAGLALDPYPMATSSHNYYITGTFNTEGSCPFAAGTNTAILSNINGGTAVYTSSACVDVDWCNNIPDYTAPGPITENDLITQFGSATILNKVIKTDFDITFNPGGQIYFHNCLIIMGKGTKINMTPGSTTYMLLDGTVIKGCGIMWSGIEMGNENQLRMMNSSSLRDANEGISATGNAAFVVENSEITECVTGITTPFNNGAYNSVYGYVSGTTFGMVHNTKLKKMYASQNTGCLNTNCHVETPKAGMLLNNTVMTIGDKLGSPNHFLNLCNGIIGMGSKLTVFNSFLNNILPNFAKNKYFTFDGSALVSMYDQSPQKVPGNLILTSLPVNTGITIDNVKYGVYTDYSDLITYARVKILSSEYGFYCTNNRQRTTEINGCRINSRLSGIEMAFNAGAAKMQAAVNIINITGSPSGQGIVLREGSGSASANYILSHNNITLTDGLYGILSQSAYKPNIANNIINQTAANGNTLISGNSGIYLGYSHDATLNCNIITSNYLNTTFGTTGLSINNSMRFNISCNSTNGHYWGVYVGGDCSGSDDNFKGNVMTNNYEGLYLNKFALMGLQHERGNKWINYSGTYGAENNNLAGLLLSEFDANTFFTTEYPSIPSGQAAWFVHSTIPIYLCRSSCTIIDDGSDEGGDNPTYLRAVARDSATTVDYIPEGKNIAQLGLFEVLATDSVLVSSDTVLTNFYTNKEAGSIGKLYDVKDRITNCRLLNPYQALLITLSDSLINLKRDSIGIVDSLLFINVTSPLKLLRQGLINDLNVLQGTKNNIIAQNDTVAAGALDTARLINNIVIPHELPEGNLRFINEIYLLFEHYGRDTLSFYWNQILGIAQQCPYAGGNAVYTARNFVALFNDTIIYNDAAVCLLSSIYRQSNGSLHNKIISDILVIPNPADDKIDVVLQNNEEGICQIEIINYLGEIILKERIGCNENRKTIDTINLSPGIYVVKVKPKNSTIKIAKLIIQR